MRISDWSSDVCSSDLEIVGAQQVEGRRHVGALEVALVLHLLLEGGELHLVDEHAELAGLLEIQHGGEEGGRLHPGVLLGRHVGQRAGEQRAAEAVADDVGIRLAGRPRSEERRGGKECVSTFSWWWSPAR